MGGALQWGGVPPTCNVCCCHREAYLGTGVPSPPSTHVADTGVPFTGSLSPLSVALRAAVTGTGMLALASWPPLEMAQDPL
eukprot:1150472-Pelagomonas_calceolata.AAC.1